MPITIQIESDARPPIPKKVPPKRVVQEARNFGHPNAEKALAVTLLSIRPDQSKIEYDKRPPKHPTEFRFTAGVLKLIFEHTIYIANDLSSCEHYFWVRHEQDHVRVSESIMKQMEREIRSHHNLKTIFWNMPWRPYSQSLLKSLVDKNEVTIKIIFKRVLKEARNHIDTKAEYARIRRRIFNVCPDPFYHTVERGESLSKLALKYYGNYRFWPSIYNYKDDEKNIDNKKIIGSDPDYITPGQRLVIPKTP